MGNLPIFSTDHPKAIRTSLLQTIAHNHIVRRDVNNRSKDRTPREWFHGIAPPFLRTSG
jgi:hypothetical protein